MTHLRKKNEIIKARKSVEENEAHIQEVLDLKKFDEKMKEIKYEDVDFGKGRV